MLDWPPAGSWETLYVTLNHLRSAGCSGPDDNLPTSYLFLGLIFFLHGELYQGSLSFVFRPASPHQSLTAHGVILAPGYLFLLEDSGSAENKEILLFSHDKLSLASILRPLH